MSPPSPYISFFQVAKGFDSADDELIDRMHAGDLLISADIPLAASALEKGCAVLSPRGERYSKDTIAARLTMRDFMETMRASGIQSGGPPTLNQADSKRFADELNNVLPN